MKCFPITTPDQHARKRRRCSGASVYKPLFFVSLLVFAGLAAFILNTSKKQKEEIIRLEAQAAELQTLRAAKEEWDRTKANSPEIDRLRKEAEEVVKLRGEVVSLRPLVKEKQQLIAQIEQLKGSVQQWQQAGAEMATLKNQNQQMAGVLAAQQTGACVTHLKVIEGAKAQWAVQFARPAGSIPADTDLFGPGRPVPNRPACPAGGVYALGAVGVKATCSVPGHAF